MAAHHSRKFNMLDRLFLGQDPPLPFLRAVGHASEDDLRDLQAGLAQTD